jgi:Cu/Ag efflux protein CusF
MKDTLDGDAHVNVMFEVDAIQYIKGEIINGCRVIKKEPNGVIHAKSEYAGIQMQVSANMSIFKEGDVIPVIVKMVRYNVNQSAISVLSVPFMPLPNTVVYYKINDVLNKQEIAFVNELQSQIKTEEDAIKKLDVNAKKIYKFFVDLLSNKEPSMEKGKKLNIADITSFKSGVIWKPEMAFGSMDLYTSDLKDDSKVDIINESPLIAFSTMLVKHLSNLQTLRGFIKYYPKITNISEHKNIWKMYTSLKNSNLKK